MLFRRAPGPPTTGREAWPTIPELEGLEPAFARRTWERAWREVTTDQAFVLSAVALCAALILWRQLSPWGGWIELVGLAVLLVLLVRWQRRWLTDRARQLVARERGAAPD